MVLDDGSVLCADLPPEWLNEVVIAGTTYRATCLDQAIQAHLVRMGRAIDLTEPTTE